MKKAFLLFVLSLALTFSAVSVMAAESPIADTNDDDAAKDDNDSKTSPKTGVDMTLAYVAIVSAAGVALVSAKKLSEAK
ncbi:MAG: hypothetical protein ACI4DS_07025 [Eubacterium sp.]